jgi:hypothetical protein
VVIRVPELGRGRVRVLAVRDEDPQRAWRPFGAWWPDRPGVRGVMDELDGGAWLAADHSTLTVLAREWPATHRRGRPSPGRANHGALTLIR